jgi:outer membrane protein assembly factor BamB
MHAAALAFLLLAFPDSSTAPTDVWPQWRGPTADSVTATRGLPTRWSKTENVVWKAPIPGWGVSTPAIWKDAIFLTTQVDDKIMYLVRVDRKTGKIVWQRETGQGMPKRKGPVGNLRNMDESNFASPSPVTDGTHVWVHFGNGDYQCWDFAGDKVWGINLLEQLGPYTIWWGHANSPVIVGDLLISVCIQDPKGGGKSYVVAHEKLTGKQRWYTPRDTGATGEPGDSYTTPLVHRTGGRTEVIIFGGNVLDAYDPASGKQLWTAKPFTGNRVISGPTLIGDTVYAVQGMKGPLFAIKAGGDGDVTKSNVLWKYVNNGNPDAASPVFANGFVFLATNPGTAVCVDATTAKEMWKERIGDGFRATPLVAEGRVYFFTKEGKATVVEAAREFKVVAQSDLGEEIIASPAVASGDLFVRTKGHLYRIGSGKE